MEMLAILEGTHFYGDFLVGELDFKTKGHRRFKIKPIKS